jgi:hypothetical protein
MSLRPVSAATAWPRPSGAGCLLGSALMWSAAMWPQLYARIAFGPICSGHGGLFALHCPGCYAAAALAGVGVLLAIPDRKAR